MIVSGPQRSDTGRARCGRFNEVRASRGKALLSRCDREKLGSESIVAGGFCVLAACALVAVPGNGRRTDQTTSK